MVAAREITEFNTLDEVSSIHFMIQHDSTSKYDQLVVQNIITFDTETSNGYANPKTGVAVGFQPDNLVKNPNYYKELIPVSIMYIWMCAIETFQPPAAETDIMVFYGRTTESCYEFINLLAEEIRIQAFCTDEDIEDLGRDACLHFSYKQKGQVRAFIYIHNFGFDFQALRNVPELDEQFCKVSRKGRCNTFAREARKPLKSLATVRKVKFEFRDSYVLTQKSLAAWSEDEHLPVTKLAEPKDFYDDIFTPESTWDVLNAKYNRKQYCINDVVTMVHGLDKYRSKYGSIENIPLTQTGCIRRVLVDRVVKENPKWASICADVTLNYTLDLFKDLCNAFVGGWTHSNAMMTGEVVNNIWHGDFASSYPTVMCTRTYPVYKFKTYYGDEAYDEFMSLDMHDIEDPDLEYHYMITVKLNNVTAKTQNTFWSVSKCQEISLDTNESRGCIVDNGKIEWCRSCTITMTDLDWNIFRKVYDFDDDFDVIKLSKSVSDYLPKELIETILDYYGYKTTLKMKETDPEYTPEIESRYKEAKQFINAIYGCAVTKIVTDDVSYVMSEWVKSETTEEDFREKISSTNEDTSFISYQIGVWVTAWARYNLWTLIEQLDSSVAYGDTDSLFLDEYHDHSVVVKYNENVEKIENMVADRLGIDPAKYAPCTRKGVSKRLGIFAEEDDCGADFKSLGAKRYVTDLNGEIACTIAGLPKSSGKEKIKSLDDFNPSCRWSVTESGKKTAIYNDDQPKITWTDVAGNSYTSFDKYGCCIMPVSFDLSMSEDYQMLIDFLQNGIDISDDRFSHISQILL